MSSRPSDLQLHPYELVRDLSEDISLIRHNFTVPAIHVSADLRDEGVAAGGDSPHRVFLTLILLPFRWISTPGNP